MTKQEEYWERYIEYWLKRVGDSNNQSDRSDHTPDDTVMQSYISLLIEKIKSSQTVRGGGGISVLDYGCGFGRSYPYFKELNIDYFGCDIAQSCIDYTQQQYPSINTKKLLEGNRIPFDDNFFDGIFCYGVFDACDQSFTLLEMVKKLKDYGILLLTGKNYNYFDDDQEALYAEEKARENQHPNYFTKTSFMLEELQKRNFKILETRYFLRRSDGAPNIYTCSQPEQFYTYTILIQKIPDSKIQQFGNLSDKYSETFLRVNK